MIWWAGEIVSRLQNHISKMTRLVAKLDKEYLSLIIPCRLPAKHTMNNICGMNMMQQKKNIESWPLYLLGQTHNRPL